MIRYRNFIKVFSSTMLALAAIGCIPAYSKSSKPNSLDSARKYFINGNVQAAFADCNKAIKQNPQNDEAILLRGWLLLYANKPQRAMAEFNKASKLNPNNFNAYKSRCILYRQLKEYDLSQENAKKAIELAPKDSEALYLYAICLILNGNHKSAISYLDRSIENGKKHPLLYHLYYWRGRTKQMLDDDKGAVEDLTACLENIAKAQTENPKVEVGESISMAFFRTEYDSKKFRKNFGRLERANSYTKLGHYENAIKDLNYLIASNKKESLLIEERGHNYLLLGKYKEAMKDLNRALLLSSSSSDLYLELATTNFCLERYHRVPDLIDSWILKQGYKDDYAPYCYFLKYTSLIRSKDFKEAHEYLNLLDEKLSKKDNWNRACFLVLRKSQCCKKLKSLGSSKPDSIKLQIHILSGLFYSLVRKENLAKIEFKEVANSKRKDSLEYAVARAELTRIQ